MFIEISREARNRYSTQVKTAKHQTVLLWEVEEAVKSEMLVFRFFVV